MYLLVFIKEAAKNYFSNEHKTMNTHNNDRPVNINIEKDFYKENLITNNKSQISIKYLMSN